MSSVTGKTSAGSSLKGSVLHGSRRRKGWTPDRAGRIAVRVLLQWHVLGKRERNQGWEEGKEKERNLK